MVLLGRIELPASSLPMTRSTTELQQRLSLDCGRYNKIFRLSSGNGEVLSFLRESSPVGTFLSVTC